ncbi:MAG: hypothetical protein OSJ76_07670 [Alphaproteobacteria bacterium]|nr:hypothetical protein [Alphaproteobacteria bacterium]
MSKKIIVLFVLLLLSACGVFGSYYEAEPVGVGKGVDELKLSPCACLQLELPKTLPDWFVETI